MATTYIHPNFNTPAVANQPGNITHRISTAYIPTAATGFGAVINDVLKVFQMPRGAKLIGGHIECGDLDSGTALTLDLIITDGTTTKTMINASTVGQAGGIVYDSTATSGQQTGVRGYTLTNKNFYVALKASAAATGILAPAAGIKVGISYTMDVEGGEI